MLQCMEARKYFLNAKIDFSRLSLFFEKILHHHNTIIRINIANNFRFGMQLNVGKSSMLWIRRTIYQPSNFTPI